MTSDTEIRKLFGGLDGDSLKLHVKIFKVFRRIFSDDDVTIVGYTVNWIESDLYMK